MKQVVIAAGALMLLFSPLAQAQLGTPVVSDSRIKTLVYNENDVYSLLTHYGYQSNVEFGEGEKVQTVSVGDRVAWQIVPAGRRLFIKAMEENAHTNMTVVTNKRAYQFDLRSSGRTPLHPSEELVYVVRFFYPLEQRPSPNPPLFSDQLQGNAGAMPYAAPQMQHSTMPAAKAVLPPYPHMPAFPASTSEAFPPRMQQTPNYDYTLTGPEAISPVRIYDNGEMTFFTFPSSLMQPVRFYGIGPAGQKMPLNARLTANGEYQVNAVFPQILIEIGSEQVMVYNETMPTA